MEEPPPATLTIRVPEAQFAGTYSNFVTIWHGQDEFTLDFLVTGLPQPGPDGVKVDSVVVSRIKVPTSVIFKIAQAIAENVDHYEKTFGPLTPRPFEPPKGTTP